MMLEQAQSTLPADFAVINLGSGQEWITSRLFIAAVMLERMRGVKVFVFLESTPGTTRRFVAVAPLSLVRWSLAQRFPWLEAAWVRAYLSVFPGSPQGDTTLPENAAWLPDPRTLSMTPTPIESSSGALNSCPRHRTRPLRPCLTRQRNLQRRRKLRCSPALRLVPQRKNAQAT